MSHPIRIATTWRCADTQGPPALAQIEQRATERNAAIIKAHATGAYSYQQIAEHFGLHFTTVGKVVRKGV